MKIKKILSGVVAGALALSTLAGMSFATSAEEAATPTAIKTWMSDASTKASAWWGDANKDPFAFGGDKDSEGNPVAIPGDLSKAKSLEVTLKTATDNINGSFGVGTGEDFTWASADWSINYDFDEAMWMLEDSDVPEITVAASEALPGEGNVYTITYTDIPTILGATPSAGATAEFKINGYNRTGSARKWVETPVELMTLKVYDENGLPIIELPAAEESSSEVSSEEETSSDVEVSSDEESSEAPAPATTVIKNWTSDASSKASAWWGDANKDPFAFGGDKDSEGNPVEYPLDWSQAKSLEVKLATATDNINGSFGVGTGEDFTWASADWSINYDFDEAMWMLEDSDAPEITVAASEALPGEGNVYTVTYTDIPTILGATPSAGATAEFKLNGYNRTGSARKWVETPVDLISVVVKDADGNTIFELPVVEEESSSEIESSSEEESSSEIESSSEEESSSEVEVEPTWTDNQDGTFTLATHYLKDSKDNNSLSIDPAKLGITDPSKVRAIKVNAVTTGDNAYYAWGMGADDAVDGWTQAWNDEDTPNTVTVEFPNGLAAESWPYFQTSWNNKGENTLTISFEVTFAADPEPAEAGEVKYQVSSDKTAIRFVYIVDEAVVAAAENGAIDIATADGVTTTPVVKAYKSLKAGGQTISAGEGKVFIISPTVKNVASDVTATFKLDGVKDATRTYTYAG